MVTAFIPARGGSERIPKKNIKELAGHPLLAYAIAAAKHAGIFDEIYVVTEDKEISDVAKKYDAEVITRTEYSAQGDSPDMFWLAEAISYLENAKKVVDEFMIVRTTTPFRTADTLRRAWQMRPAGNRMATLRSVGPPKDHPDKMYRLRAGFLIPYNEPTWRAGPMPYDMPTQTLEPLVSNNSCLLISNIDVLKHCINPSGLHQVAFFMDSIEGFDINDELDWDRVEAIVEKGLTKLEPIP